MTPSPEGEAPTKELVELGRRVREIRTSKKFTLDELSERSGVGEMVISQLERASDSTSVETLVRLGNAMNVPVAAFFCDVESLVKLLPAEAFLRLRPSVEELVVAAVKELVGGKLPQ